MFPLRQKNNLEQSENGVWVLESSGPFAYSEGDEAEAYLRACFECVDDLTSDSIQLQNKIKDWSSEYHLSPARANLVRPVKLEGMKNILELGSGCGAITRYLGERDCTVEAVEGSFSRAELTRKRCRELKNVHVINANFNSLAFPDDFYDAVFLIGVLEYAAMFLPDQKSHRESLTSILKIIRKSLKPEGILVIAIENRMGLKYWLGAGEDHFGEPDIGLYGYPGGNGIRTYDKREWEGILPDAGINSYAFVYPFPDYKLPRVLISEDFVSDDMYAYSLLNRICSSDRLTGWEARDDEFLRWKVLHKSGYLGEFANSFLIISSARENALLQAFPYDFVHFSSESRKIKFRTVTGKLKNDSRVLKRRICPAMNEATGKSGPVSQLLNETDYQQGTLLTVAWLEACCRDDADIHFKELLGTYCDFVKEQFNNTADRGSLVDLLPSNIILAGSPPGYKVIDLEWSVSHPFDFDFIIFRALLWFGYHNRFTLSRFNQEKPWFTVGNFIEYGFAQLELLLHNNLDEYLKLEDKIHAEIVRDGMSYSTEVIYNSPIDHDDSGRKISDTDVNAVAREDIPDLPVKPGMMKKIVYSFLKRCSKLFKRMAYQTNEHYRTLAKSGLFDERYYVGQDKDFDVRYTHPLIHYIERGWQEVRNPNPLFDSSYYRQMNPDCEGMDPLLHYVQSGWHAGANPIPLFFTAWYAAEYPESTVNEDNPLAHYLRSGWKSGCKPNPYMELEEYMNSHPELKSGGINPLAHYIVHGFRDPSGPLPFFDADFYREDNPAANKLSLSPLAHYAAYGVHEGRAPNRFFDPVYYLKEYSESGPDQLTAFLHYNYVGWKRDYRPNRLFDSAYYGKTYPEFSVTHLHPLLHYQLHGIFNGYYPCGEIADFAKKPVISIVTPVFNTDELLLRRCIHSVMSQAYPHWELCLADDCSDVAHVRAILEEYSQLDKRIKVRFLEKRRGISGASNAAAKMATGEYIGFLDHDDELTMDALYEVVKALNEHAPDMLYTDEDLVNLESRHLDSFFKPDFNPELLLTHNYITHFMVVRSELFSQVGEFSSEYEGAQDFDLVLKLTEQADRIFHIPKRLYKWRASETSTSVNHSQKIYADAAGKKALEAALQRRGIKAAVEQGQWRFYYRARRFIAGTPSVSLIVFMAETEVPISEWYTRFSGYLAYEPLEIHLILNSRSGQNHLNGLDHTSHQFHIHTVEEFVRLAAMYNNIVLQCGGQYLLFVDAAFLPGNDEWIRSLLEFAQQPATGAVTGYIEPPADEKENLEIKGDMSWRMFRRFFLEASRDINNIYCEQNIRAVPIELFMVERQLFKQAGGFDDQHFPQIFYDMDFSLKLLQLGYANVYTPFCRGKWSHREPKIGGTETAAGELAFFREKWHEVLKKGDPYYNPGKILAANNISVEQWLQWYSGVQQQVKTQEKHC